MSFYGCCTILLPYFASLRGRHSPAESKIRMIRRPCFHSHTVTSDASFQPWNLSYALGLHLLFLFFRSYNKTCSYRGRLWRLQQTSSANHRNQEHLINEHWKHHFKASQYSLLTCDSHYEAHPSIYTREIICRHTTQCQSMFITITQQNLHLKTLIKMSTVTFTESLKVRCSNMFSKSIIFWAKK